MQKKTDEYEIIGALNPCVQTRKVKNPYAKQFMSRSSGRMTELKSIITVRENVQCQDADVKLVVRDPMDDDRVLVESGAEMTLV